MNVRPSIGVVVAVLLCAGVATAATSARTAPVISGGSPTQRQTIRELAHALGGTQIHQIRITAADAGTELVMQPAIRDRSRPGASVRLGWDAQLLSYSFLRLSLIHHLPRVIGFSAGGQHVVFRSAAPRPIPTFDRLRIVPPVARAVKRSGARVIEFNLFRPAAPAFAVVVLAQKPSTFLAHRLGSVITALNSVAPRLDGFYIGVADSERRIVFAYSRTAERATVTTTIYVRPDLLGCAKDLPVENEVAPDGAPPCPR